MSAKDSWPHGPPADPQPSGSPQQQQPAGQPGLQNAPLPSHPSQQRPLPPYQGGPQQQQGPVLPPPSSMGSAAPFYNQGPHSMSLPGLASASHQMYSLPGISSTPSHVASNPGPQIQNNPPPSGAHGPQGQPLQQAHVSQPPPSNPNGAPISHPGLQNASPSQALSAMQTTPPLGPQASQMPSLSSVQSQQAQAQQPQQSGPPGPPQHPLAAIANSAAQQNGPQHPGAGSISGQGPSPSQQAAASQMPPSSNVSGHGPGGPILNVGTDLITPVKGRLVCFLEPVYMDFFAKSPLRVVKFTDASLEGRIDGPVTCTFIKVNSKPRQQLLFQALDEYLLNQSATNPLTMDTALLNPLENTTTRKCDDALSYLDQVKLQFQDQPDVYNKFLDIMKDFKSQAIDTPGVIDRVSSLFSGHPSLIQGFNTFLPPGYRIECSQDPRDTKITVTTPSGIHHASSGETVSIAGNPGMPLSQAAAFNAGNQGPSRFYDQQGAQWGSADPMYGYGGAGVRPGAHASQAQQQTPSDILEMHRQQHMHAQYHAHAQQAQAQAQAVHAHQQAQAQAHAQQQAHQASVQQGVNQLQSAAAHTNGTVAKGPAGGMAPGPGTPVGDSRSGGKGPVEFNHAISYVNKIKNRFSNQPEIYKTFLEILQTYQRESKPIQDVYSQVTQLFNSAPDLLEDFKQFLPESAAQARAAAAAKAAADDAAGVGMGPIHPPPSAGNARLPAVGTFAPPPTAGKEPKKGKRNAAAVSSAQAELKGDATSGMGRGSTKRHKISQKPSATTEQQIMNISPTLTPFKPQPFGPPTDPGATQEELAFFDRVKKFIGNKQTYNEFLKLLNLFSQSLISKDTLVEKVHNFIGGNSELINWFKRFVGFESSDLIVENSPMQTQNKVRLSVCRGLGPSYRLLPKYEAQKPCSGRDEMCWEVLNDQWASHPTWASEDSGFVAHKKNQHEDSLHRIEEERHDYDFNIEANLRTIQLLEPIAQRIAGMSPEEKAVFKLQPGLGGQSQTIYKRVIKKVYDKERGLEVIDFLHNNPVHTVPVVLKRLKQKDEEWKAAQREWQKVWRDQTARVFWKSLDHQGITVKQNDKKHFTIKNLISDIQAKHKEQHNRRISSTTPAPEYQFKYSFNDFGIILDASRLLAVSLEHNQTYSANDREKIDGFIKSFIPLFFGMNSREVEDTVNSVARKSPDDDGDDGYSASNDIHSFRGRQRGRQDTDLLKDVLKRNKPGKQVRSKEQNMASPSRESRESTPGTGSHDQDVDMDVNSDRQAKEDGTWIQRPLRHPKSKAPLSPVEPEQVTPRNVYTLYCNNTIYGFFRLFQLLCQRLSDVKACEESIKTDVDIRKTHKVADELNIMSHRVRDLFTDTSATAAYYPQVLDMCEKYIEGEIEPATFEEGLRSVYVQQGWKLYTIDRLLNGIVKAIQNIVPSDAKEKNSDKEKNAEIILRFQKDRERRKFTREKGEYQELISYRKHVESMLGPDDNVFRIDWHEDSQEATIRFVPRDEVTVNDELDRDERWKYYIESYMMVSPTEGVPIDDPERGWRKVFLRRNMPNEADEEGHSSQEADGTVIVENMEVRICVNTYRLFFQAHTEDFVDRTHARRNQDVDLTKVAERRKRRWREKVFPKLGWKATAEAAEFDEMQHEWERWVRDGPKAEPAPARDVTMGGT